MSPVDCEHPGRLYASVIGRSSRFGQTASQMADKIRKVRFRKRTLQQASGEIKTNAKTLARLVQS